MGKPESPICPIPAGRLRFAWTDWLVTWGGPMTGALWLLVGATTGITGVVVIGGIDGAIVGVGGVALAFGVTYLWLLARPRQHFDSYFEESETGFLVNLVPRHDHSIAEVWCFITEPSGRKVEAGPKQPSLPRQGEMWFQYPRHEHFPLGPADGEVAAPGRYELEWLGRHELDGKLRRLAPIEMLDLSPRGQP